MRSSFAILGAFAAFAFLLQGDAVAQTKSVPTTTTKVSGKFVAGNPKTKIDAKTHLAVERVLTNALGKLAPADRTKLGNALFGLYITHGDSSPHPHITLTPPADPPLAKACKDCGKFQALPADPCAGLRADLKKLKDDEILKGVIADVLQLAKQGLVDLQFYGGIADLVSDIVTTTLSLVTAGTGGGLSKAALGVLKGLAMDQVKGSLTDAAAGMLPPPLDSAVSGELSVAALDALIASANAAIVAAAKAWSAKMAEYQKCSANYAAALKTANAANAAVAACRKAEPAYCL